MQALKDQIARCNEYGTELRLCVSESGACMVLGPDTEVIASGGGAAECLRDLDNWWSNRNEELEQRANADYYGGSGPRCGDSGGGE